MRRNASDNDKQQPAQAQEFKPRLSEDSQGATEPPRGQAQPPSDQREQPSPDIQALFKQLVDRANRGDREALTQLRQYLDKHPQIWQRAGDLAAIAEKNWTELLAEKNHLVAESVKRMVDKLKSGLAGEHPTQLEALLVDQVAVCLLGTQYAEMQAATTGGTLHQAAFRLKRAESSQKRFLNAVKTLTTLRALAPEGLVPLNDMRLHRPNRKMA